jgi:hypothetical protein
MKIAFFIRHFGERGTEVAIHDYAHYNESILKNTSVIICFTKAVYQKHGLTFQEDVYTKFTSRFPVLHVNEFSEIEDLLETHKIDVFYTLTHGDRESYPFGEIKRTRYAVHCVFSTQSPHGSIYMPISNQLNTRFGTAYPVLPHMVTVGKTLDTLRSKLGIPENAIVFGRHGAIDTFDIQSAHEAIIDVATRNPYRYFLFMNTNRFCELPNVIHLPRTVDYEEKRRFMNTCDAYIHARRDGETFGLAIAEFAVLEKPVITCTICTDDAHLRILQDKAIKYTTKNDLIAILESFERGQIDMTYNGYKEYSPESVMTLFRDLVCQPLPKHRPFQFIQTHRV